MCSPSSAQKNPGFGDTLKSAKNIHDDKDDEVQDIVIKKEPSSHYKGISSGVMCLFNGLECWI